jgi:hypothetical protein
VLQHHQTKLPRQEPKSQFKTHVRGHDQVTGNEFWYSDKPPVFKNGFTAAKTKERHTQVTGILLRAAKKAEKNSDTELAEAYYQVLDKIEGCRSKRRCGSLACPCCAGAFQKAKVAAQEIMIESVSKNQPHKHLVFVTLIPKTKMYEPGKFHDIDVNKANRWLKDVLKSVGKRMMLGSADLGWETRRGDGYVQVHWHLTMWTSNIRELKTKLANLFPRVRKSERPVEVKEAEDVGFLGYMNKGIKWEEILRRNRRQMAELLLVLDGIEPLEMMVLCRLRVSAQSGRLAFKPIG